MLPSVTKRQLLNMLSNVLHWNSGWVFIVIIKISNMFSNPTWCRKRFLMECATFLLRKSNSGLWKPSHLAISSTGDYPAIHHFHTKNFFRMPERLQTFLMLPYGTPSQSIAVVTWANNVVLIECYSTDWTLVATKCLVWNLKEKYELVTWK